jgi:hypothetical protein
MREIYKLANRLKNMQNNGDYGVMYKEYTKQLVELLVGNDVQIENLNKLDKTE